MDFASCRKIGILGGTFNPIHNGHLMIAKCALRQFRSLEAIMFLPNNLPAYKDTSSIITSEHRLMMLELAIEAERNMFVSDMELVRGGLTYTIDSLEQIHSVNPKLQIAYIIGADSLLSFTKWYRYEDILKHCNLLVAGRESERAYLKEYADKLLQTIGYGSIHIMRNPNMDISSSAIRKELSNGKIPTNCMPRKVIDYIVSNKLYGMD